MLSFCFFYGVAHALLFSLFGWQNRTLCLYVAPPGNLTGASALVRAEESRTDRLGSHWRSTVLSSPSESCLEANKRTVTVGAEKTRPLLLDRAWSARGEGEVICSPPASRGPWVRRPCASRQLPQCDRGPVGHKVPRQSRIRVALQHDGGMESPDGWIDAIGGSNGNVRRMRCESLGGGCGAQRGPLPRGRQRNIQVKWYVQTLVWWGKFGIR